MKINISINDELLERIDKYADANYMSRSGCISLGMASYLNSNEAIVLMRNLGLAMQKIADTGVVDDDTMKEMEELSQACQYLVKNFKSEK